MKLLSKAQANCMGTLGHLGLKTTRGDRNLRTEEGSSLVYSSVLAAWCRHRCTGSILPFQAGVPPIGATHSKLLMMISLLLDYCSPINQQTFLSTGNAGNPLNGCGRSRTGCRKPSHWNTGCGSNLWERTSLSTL